MKTAARVMRERGVMETAMLIPHNIGLLFKFGYLRILSKVIRKVGHLYSHTARKFNGKINILYVTEEFEAINGQTIRYRIHNLREALKGLANTRYELIENGIDSDSESIKWADLIVLMRIRSSPRLEKLVRTAKTLKIPTIFDIDDLIFLPQYASWYAKVIGDETKETIDRIHTDFSRYEWTFLHCDFLSSSTNYIANLAESLGKPSFVVHNGLNKKQVQIAEKSAELRRHPDFCISYLSGTNTHNRDFESCRSAVEKALMNHKSLKLRIIGFLNTDTMDAAVREKTETYQFMRWDRLMRFSARSLLNIAPLDLSNPFCQAKSELKYFEAAVAGVPTIASATDTFRLCIKDGINGFLVNGSEDWYQSISRLIEDHSLYKTVSMNARGHALEHFAPKAIANEALQAYEKIIRDYRSRIDI